MAMRSSRDHFRFNGMIFFVGLCHHPTKPLQILHSDSIIESFIPNLTDLKLVTPRLQLHSIVRRISYAMENMGYYWMHLLGYLKNTCF